MRTPGVGRIYLPAADLRLANIRDHELLATSTSGRLRGAISVQVDRARGLLSVGEALVRRLSGWSRVAVSGYIAGGLATTDAIQAADFEVLADPVRPARSRTAVHAIHLVTGR